MFAGIVEKKTKILQAEREGTLLRVRIAKPKSWRLSKGQSVNVNGICSTVVKSSQKFFDVEYMPDTLSKTTASSLAKGAVVNLERSLKYGQRIDGHPVQGHVDTKVSVRDVRKRGASLEITFVLDARLSRLIAEHGSIAVNGVSLTIARKRRSSVTVGLIPYTARSTNLGLLQKGDAANVEIDLLARYEIFARRRIR